MMPELGPIADLRLEEFYHPGLERVVKGFTTLTFAVSAVVYPFAVFVILTKSTSQMGNYRNYLVLQLTFAFVFDFMVFLLEPMFIFPIPMAYINSYFHFGTSALMHMLASFVVCLTGVGQSLFLSLAYRLVMIFEWKWLHFAFSNKLLFTVGNVVVFAGLETFILVPIYMEVRDAEVVKAAMARDVPALTDFYTYCPDTTGFHPELTTFWLRILIFEIAAIAVLIPLGFVLMHFIFIARLKLVQKRLAKHTFDMHVMLYKALSVQTVITGVCFVVPFMAFIGVYIAQIRSGSIYASLCLAIASFHLLFDIFSVLYFVKPYRMYVRRLARFWKPSAQRAVHDSSLIWRTSYHPATRRDTVMVSSVRISKSPRELNNHNITRRSM